VRAAPAEAPARIAAARTGTAGRREARLREEFAELYPGLRAGEWAPAAVIADRVLAQALLRYGQAGVRGRALVDTHFEFRHGASRGGERLRLGRRV
jgi:hypothetical protein